MDHYLNGAAEMHLLNEAMARARMPKPQMITSEAPRSARRIAMEARHYGARLMGN